MQAVDFRKCEEDHVEHIYHGKDEFQAVPLTEVKAIFFFDSDFAIYMYMILELRRIHIFAQ